MTDNSVDSLLNADHENWTQCAKLESDVESKSGAFAASRLSCNDCLQREGARAPLHLPVSSQEPFVLVPEASALRP